LLNNNSEQLFLANEKGHMMIGGCDSVELAQQFGTPLYILDEATIRENCRMYHDSIVQNYDGHGLALYASKALSCMAMYKIINSENCGIDVVSGGELYTAVQAGFPMNKVYFHGNNKSNDEIAFALEQDIHCIVVDNIYELKEINRQAGEMGKKASISFRIKPGIDAHTHEFIQTGQIDSKFGVALENGEAHEIVALAVAMENVELIGVHCHIGSQILDVDPFVKAAEVMLGFVADIKRLHGVEIKELNLGGGFGVRYTKDDDRPDYNAYMQAVSKRVKEVCREYDLSLPFIVMEPGRSIVAEAGVTLYTVGGIKEIKDVRTYVSIDGGMTDNPRYALYESEYEVAIANKFNEKKDKIVTVAGKSCESGDLIGKDLEIQTPEVGDTLVVFATGAYNYSMSSNYNRNCKPPVVLVKDGKARVIVKRETYEDIIRNDIVPEDL